MAGPGVVVGVVGAILLGLAGGAGLSAALLMPEFSPAVRRSGPWLQSGQAGSPTADPYSLALHAMRGDLPMPPTEGVALIADQDSEGRGLLASCNYALSGQFPVARAWTLAAFDRKGQPMPSPLGSASLTSFDAVADGAITTVRIGPDPMPGNWLALIAGGPMVIALRFYDAPVSLAGGLEARRVPELRRLGCRP